MSMLRCKKFKSNSSKVVKLNGFLSQLNTVASFSTSFEYLIRLLEQEVIKDFNIISVDNTSKPLQINFIQKTIKMLQTQSRFEK